MLLNVTIDDQGLTLDVPDSILKEAEPFFARMDIDMDQGWQMSREWVARPDRFQRCQIAANKLLTALENENRNLSLLMAGYILSRLPRVRAVDIDTAGDMTNTRITVDDADTEAAPAAPTVQQVPAGLSKIELMSLAAQDVSKVFKVGKAFRFSVYDHYSEQWRDAPTVSDKQEAETLRELAVKQRYDELARKT